MNKSTKAVLYNFLGFAPIFLLLYYLLGTFTDLTGLWVPATSFMITLILSPKFQSVKYMGDEKIYMKWFFLKDVKEVK